MMRQNHKVKATTAIIATFAVPLAAVGGAASICVSVGLFISLLVRDGVSPNWLNMFTIVGAAAAGVALIRGGRTRTLALGSAALILAVLPAALGWIWLLYVPSAICAAGALRKSVRLGKGTTAR